MRTLLILLCIKRRWLEHRVPAEVLAPAPGFLWASFLQCCRLSVTTATVYWCWQSTGGVHDDHESAANAFMLRE